MQLFYNYHKCTRKGITYTDQTGAFPYQSSRGNKYIFICYDYDANAILCAPLKNRNGETIAKAWTTCFNRLTKNGHKTDSCILDNEMSPEVKSAMDKAEVNYQKVPPGIHRRNAAERAIQTFKNHLLAGLASCDPSFPIREWDRLLPQAELTLNLLRNSRVNPKLSAHACLFGNHDFNKISLCPPGTKALSHSKADQRTSWSFHAEDGYYIGPAMEHYRCIKMFIPKTTNFTFIGIKVLTIMEIIGQNIFPHHIIRK